MADVKTVRGTIGGVVVTTSEENAGRVSGFEPLDETATEESGYEAMKVADLQAEIDRRNEGREEADLIPSDGKKADLIAALEADDTK